MGGRTYKFAVQATDVAVELIIEAPVPQGNAGRSRVQALSLDTT